MATDDDLPLLPAVVAAPGGRRASGAVRRAEAAALPRAFLLYRRHDRAVFGAGSAVDCLLLNDDTLHWVFDAVFFLAEPVILDRARVRYASQTFSVVPEYEAELRREEAVMGGSLNAHLQQFAGKRWRVWTCTEDTVLKLQKSVVGVGVLVTTPRNYARELGIKPRSVDRLPDFNADLEAAAAAARCGDEPDQPDVNADVANAFGPREVLERLKAGTAKHSGVSNFKYTPETLIACLQLGSQLKPKVNVHDALAEAASIFSALSQARNSGRDCWNANANSPWLIHCGWQG